MISKERILRCWTYFRRGHSTYLVFLVSLANFIVIQYRLLVEYIGALRLLFPSLILFALSFVMMYVPLATIIGWLDYRRLAVPVDMTVATRASPWHRDMAKALLLIAMGKNEEAVKILEKWTRKL